MRFIFILLSLATIACTNQSNKQNTLNSTPKGDSIQTVNTSAAPDGLPTDSAIAYIRTAFQQINAAPLTHQDFKWTADNCNNDGTATYYFTSNNEIVKVVETGAIGDGSWTTAYYYQAGRFIFSLQTDIGGPAIGPVDTLTVRKYVYADKVIRTIENNTYATTADSILTATSKEYRILAAFKSKDFGSAFCD